MDLNLIDFAFYSVTGSLLVVLLLAMGSRLMLKRAEKRSLSHRVICRLCLFAFEDVSHVKTVECPACRAVNEKGRSRKLG